MNFGFLLGLCLFSFINAKYLLVNVEDEQQVRGPKPPAPVLVTKPPVAPKRPLPTCIQPGGKCLGKTKLTLTFEFSARSVKDPAECCQGYTCVSGMCLKPRISLDGLGKMSGIDQKKAASEPQVEKAARDLPCQAYGEVCMGDWECCSQMCEDDTCVGIGDK